MFEGSKEDIRKLMRKNGYRLEEKLAYDDIYVKEGATKGVES